MGEATSKYPMSLELNGIAYDAKQDRLFVTGKLWPKLFEIRVEPGHQGATREAKHG